MKKEDWYLKGVLALLRCQSFIFTKGKVLKITRCKLLKYFNHLPEFQQEGLFYLKPSNVTKFTRKSILAYSLGATLYMPATRKDLANLIISAKFKELFSLVVCLEDSIGDFQVEEAEDLLVREIQKIDEAVKAYRLQEEMLPLLFIRVRSPQQMKVLSDRLGECLYYIAGFVFPKFTPSNAEEYLSTLRHINVQSETILYGMPILESPDILYKEKRLGTLVLLRDIIHRYEDIVLNIRIGATDLCGLYGIRRKSHTSIYDISIMNDVITDIVNLFSRKSYGYVVSGPVWEYFNKGDRILKPQLRQTPFKNQSGSTGLRIRSELIDKNLDGLIQETMLDLSNGIVGKTVIHPSHLLPVQALHVVSKEEYVDALSIVKQSKGEIGAFKSEFENKMNEMKPHLLWAEKILIKSEIYGVYHEENTFIDLFTEPAFV
jgi:citrate lyase beta subunit